MKYRRIPIIIDAELVTVDNLEKISLWCNGQIKVKSLSQDVKLPIFERVIALEGEMRANIGDYIIHDKGEFYPCKPNNFKATYEFL